MATLTSRAPVSSLLELSDLRVEREHLERIGINGESDTNNTLYFACNFCSPQNSKCFTDPALCSVAIIPKDVTLEKAMYF